MTRQVESRVRVVVTGPESSGKTTLTLGLAEHFKIPYALEYARVYLEEHGPDYDYDTLLKMAREHLIYQQDQVPKAAPIGLFDTDLTNYKIWCQEAFGRCHEELLQWEAAESDHVYLLCAPDIEWEPDPLREYEGQRDYLFELHLREIQRLGRPYSIVRGQGEARLESAVEGVQRLVKLY
jgi:nicotinamide riboside kinase